MNIRLSACVLVLTLVAPLAQAQQVMEIITLRHRTVEDAIALVRPLVPEPGVVTGMSGQLVVKTTPEVMNDVRRVLESLDRPARQLLVSVRNAGRGQQRDRALSGRLSTGTSGSGSSSTRVVIGARDRRLTTSTESDYSVRVLEGGEAFIQTGRDVPLRESRVVQQGNRTVVTQGTTFVNTSSGFYVRPRLSGDQVTLDVAPQREALRNDGSISSSSVRTTVRARLGEWVPLGGVEQRAARRDGNIGTVRRSTTRSSDGFEIRVDAID